LRTKEGKTTSLTFLGGVGEIGGNKILLETKECKIFLDFGKNFQQERKFYDEPYLSPREEKHLIALGILPNIKGLYKKDEKDSEIDGIIISHPHLDHMHYIRYVKDKVPIYCGEDTRDIIIAREFSGKSASSKEYYIANLTTKERQIFKRFVTFKSGEEVKIKDVILYPWAVDHSTPGSYGYIIYTPETTLVYTGDFRFHGPRRYLTEKFIRQSIKERPEILIIEGTNITGAKPISEKDIEEKLAQIVSCTSGLVLAGFSLTDTDRLKTFYKVAQKVGRRLVISLKQAFILYSLSHHKEFVPFNLDSPDVYIFTRDKKTRGAWEKKIIEEWGEKIIEGKKIGEQQRESILVASFYDMREMIDIEPVPGSIYILSQSEPFNEEMEIDYEKLLNWLEWYGIPVYHLHASGHADPQELKKTVADLSPDFVFLVHTERPILYQRYLGDLPIKSVICPILGKRYRIGKKIGTHTFMKEETFLKELMLE